jgi:hypothetical protein
VYAKLRQSVNLVIKTMDSSSVPQFVAAQEQPTLPPPRSERSAKRHLQPYEQGGNKQSRPSQPEQRAGAEPCLQKTPAQNKLDARRLPHSLGDRLQRQIAHLPIGSVPLSDECHVSSSMLATQTPAQLLLGSMPMPDKYRDSSSVLDALTPTLPKM